MKNTIFNTFVIRNILLAKRKSFAKEIPFISFISFIKLIFMQVLKCVYMYTETSYSLCCII